MCADPIRLKRATAESFQSICPKEMKTDSFVLFAKKELTSSFVT
jgi:hypothetical protein